MHATRRQLLGAGALVLTGCTSQAPPVDTPPVDDLPVSPPPPDPDDALRAAATARERDLLRAYDDALLAAPSLAARLGPLRAEHAEHLRSLLGPAEPPPPPSAAPVRAPRPAPGAVLAGLVRAEQAAAAAHAADVPAASRQLAGLLAVLSASEASHPVALA